MFETIRVEADPRGVATLWLAWPDKHNALSPRMMEELNRAAARLGTDPAVRVVAAAKAQCRTLGPRIDQDVIEDSIDRPVAVWEGNEAPKGIAAFFDKRKPRWQV